MRGRPGAVSTLAGAAAVSAGSARTANVAAALARSVVSPATTGSDVTTGRAVAAARGPSGARQSTSVTAVSAGLPAGGRLVSLQATFMKRRSREAAQIDRGEISHSTIITHRRPRAARHATFWTRSGCTPKQFNVTNPPVSVQVHPPVQPEGEPPHKQSHVGAAAHSVGAVAHSPVPSLMMQ